MQENQQRGEIYKCNTCGHIIEILEGGGGSLVCCGQPMELLVPKTEEEGFEKHLPVIEKTENGVKIKIGSVPHPMEENHFIQWIEVRAGDRILRKYLKPGDAPEAEFSIKDENISVLELCNIHGLWKK